MNQATMPGERFYQVEYELGALGFQTASQLSQFQAGGQAKRLVSQCPQGLSDYVHLDQYVLLIRRAILHDGVVNHRHTHF